MTKEEAIETLGNVPMDDPDRLRDAYEKKCFEVRNHLLWHPVVPTALRSRIRWLCLYGEAYSTLSGDAEERVENPYPGGEPPVLIEEAEARELIPGNDLLQVLKHYENTVAQKKLPLANSFSAPPLIRAIVDLIRVQNAYHRQYSRFFPVDWDQLLEWEKREKAKGQPEHFDPSVKIAKQVDSGTLIKGIETLAAKGIDVHEKVQDMGALVSMEGAPDEETRHILHNVMTEGYRIHKLYRQKEKRKGAGDKRR